MIARRSMLASAALSGVPAVARAAPRWASLPPTPELPAPEQSGFVSAGGARLWWGSYGAGAPVLLLHGGLANSAYWGHQIGPLARTRRVIVMDTRGHGRSSRDGQPYSYGLLARDVVALLDGLEIPRAAIVGWSDGAIVGIDLAINHRTRIERVFAFAANTDPSGVADHLDTHPVFGAFIRRCAGEYAALSPTPQGYPAFLRAISGMWATEPHYTRAQLRGIATPVLVADGDHDEAIRRPHTEMIAATIPGAGLLIQPNVSHFSMLQDPGQFTDDVARCLAAG